MESSPKENRMLNGHPPTYNNILKMENSSIRTNATKSSPMETDLEIAIYGILIVVSLLGNMLVIMVVLLNKTLRTEFNYLMVNMAVSDLTVPFLALPLEIATVATNNKWLVEGQFGDALCKILHFITDISSPVSVLSLVAIAINRFMAAVYPVRRKTLTIKLNKIFIVVTWIIPVLFYSPYFYTQKVDPTGACSWSWEPALSEADNKWATKITFLINSILFFVCPLIAITTLYSIIVFKLNKNSITLSKMLNNEQLRRRKKNNKHIFYMSIVIIAGFAILWGPFQALLFMFGVGWPRQELVQKLIMEYLWIAKILGFSSVVVNPAISFAFLKNFRRGLKNIFLWRFRKGGGIPFTRPVSSRTTRHHELTGVTRRSRETAI
ncbi:hypothetical protein QZH41_020196 [Actinostola sp. cb2023]|nr:hypothetical protein QZH41_020196 [Actinostola sp. cb2023]